MKPLAELSAGAQALGSRVAKSAFGDGVTVEPEASSDGWHGTLHRHVFEQHLSVWIPLGFLDVITEGADRVVGYVDHEAYRRADDITVLGDEEVRGIVADSEFLPPVCRIVESVTYPGPDGGRIVGVTVEGTVGKARCRWLVEINPARRLIASIRPLDDGGND